MTAAQGGEDPQRLDALQRLWTPWRMSYIRRGDDEVDGCPFCVLPARGAEQDRSSLIVHRGASCYVILNAYPYNPGHCVVVPYRHTGGFEDLRSAELHELADLTQITVRALLACSAPQGFNLGVNAGRIAGAGLPDHVHQHVVPRWGGDTNFMPVVGQTRVLPELLEETYDRLAPALAAEATR